MFASIDEQFVVFSINDSLYGIPSRSVSDIVQMQQLHRISRSVEEFVGVMNFRNKEIPVISLHVLFDEPEKAYDSNTRIIVLRYGGFKVGFVIDEIDQVQILPQEQISSTPSLSVDDCLTGIYREEKRIIGLLNLDVLLENVDVPAYLQSI